VCEPELLVHLETVAAGMRRSADWRFGPVLGAIIEALSGLRFSHLQRSALISASAVAFTAQCYRGKAAVEGARPAFQWSCPAHGISGLPIADWLFASWSTWKKGNSDHIGLVFDHITGKALSISQYNEVIREIVAPLLHTEPGDIPISSYSFRRVLPTLADIRQLPFEKRLPLGGWKAPRANPENHGTNLMPVRYADRKELTEQVAKVTATRFLAAAVELSPKPCSWECVRAVLAGVDGEAIERQAERDVAAAMPTILAPGITKKNLGQQARRLRLRGAVAPKPFLPTGDAPPHPPQPGVPVSGDDRAWLIARSGRGKAHFLASGETSSTLCKRWRAGQSSAEPAHRGTGLRAIAKRSKNICSPCSLRLTVPEQEQLALLTLRRFSGAPLAGSAVEAAPTASTAPAAAHRGGSHPE